VCWSPPSDSIGKVLASHPGRGSKKTHGLRMARAPAATGGLLRSCCDQAQPCWPAGLRSDVASAEQWPPYSRHPRGSQHRRDAWGPQGHTKSQCTSRATASAQLVFGQEWRQEQVRHSTFQWAWVLVPWVQAPPSTTAQACTPWTCAAAGAAWGACLYRAGAAAQAVQLQALRSLPCWPLLLRRAAGMEPQGCAPGQMQQATGAGAPHRRAPVGTADHWVVHPHQGCRGDSQW
jgi:hypothetical protein